jgi:beta-xylosidase
MASLTQIAGLHFFVIDKLKHIEHFQSAILILFLIPLHIFAQSVWQPDNRNGTYSNPIIYADYSDPDVIRVGNDFYLTASSFNAAPGLPILHSKDLVNWRIIGHAIQYQTPVDVFTRPQHGNGVWAPAIRYHNNYFYIFFLTPTTASTWLRQGILQGHGVRLFSSRVQKGWIDPCPFWDDMATPI